MAVMLLERSAADDLPAQWYPRVEAAGRQLRTACAVPTQIRALIDDVAERLAGPISLFAGPDPYLGQAVLAAARIVSHLRHVFTGPGVLRWFERPHPQLAGQTPQTLLSDPTEIPTLLRLASLSGSPLAS